MNLFKEPYDPDWVRIKEEDIGYSTMYRKHLEIQVNETKLTWPKVSPPLALVSVTVLAASLWSPLFLLLNAITLMVWVAAPHLRPIQQITQSFLLQKGDGEWAQKSAPGINWGKSRVNKLYRDGVTSWIEAVRQSGDTTINQKDWNKYFKELETVADRDTALMPDMQTLKALKEVLGHE